MANGMILSEGEQVHVVMRRSFDGDLRRHFVGRVEAVSDSAARLRGYAFVFDTNRNQYERRTGVRTRIIGLADSGLLINVIPSDVALDRLSYQMNEERQLVITDGAGFSMNVSEFNVRR